MKIALLAAAAAIAVAGSASATSYVYVGSWAVADGPLWSGAALPGNSPVLSGQDTAALLFGGSASDYAISTNGANPLLINFANWADGYGDTSNLVGGTPVAQNYKLGTLGTLGGDYTYPGRSAYIFDHACGVYYCAGGGGERSINYAFKIAGVPEPATWALMIGGFGLAGVALRRRRLAVA